MFGLDFGKYRSIVISIALFLLLDLGVLVLNFVISSEIAGDALNVNLAGRQRMLSQRIAKVSLQIETRAATGMPFALEVSQGAVGIQPEWGSWTRHFFPLCRLVVGRYWTSSPNSVNIGPKSAANKLAFRQFRPGKTLHNPR